jgi:hypothetical protein
LSDSSEARSELESILRELLRLDSLARQGKLSQEERKILDDTRARFARTAWKNTAALRAALQIATQHAGEPDVVGLIEYALGTQVIDNRILRDRVALDADTTALLADGFLKAAPGALRRLYLSVLRADLYQQVDRNAFHPERVLRNLESSTLSRLLGEARAMKDERALDYALFLAGRYSDLHPEARVFVEGVALDPTCALSSRLSALSSYRTGDLTQERLRVASALLAPDQNPALRAAALELLTGSDRSNGDESLKAATQDLLSRLAASDPDPQVRLKASETLLLSFAGTGGLAAAERLLASEPDAKVRAGTLHSFSLTTFASPEQTYQAQALTLRIFETEKEESVRQAAVGAFLGLVSRTIIDENSSIDSRTLGTIQDMLSALTRRPPDRSTRLFMIERLERDFEKRFPDLPKAEQYLALKRTLSQ